MPTPAYIKIEDATQRAITQAAASEASIVNIWQEGHEDEALYRLLTILSRFRVTSSRDSLQGSAFTSLSNSPRL